MTNSNADQVKVSEQITRYLFKGHHNASGPTWRGFEPRNGEVSVMRTNNLDDRNIWDIGKDFVGARRGVAPTARTDFIAEIVKQHSLEIVPETSDHELHANIVGWPGDDEKDARLEKSKELTKTIRLKQLQFLVNPTKNA